MGKEILSNVGNGGQNVGGASRIGGNTNLGIGQGITYMKA